MLPIFSILIIKTFQFSRYSFKDRYRTYIIEMIKQKLGKGFAIGGDMHPTSEEERYLQAFLLVEDIMRYRHNIRIQLLDDLSDDHIPEYMVELIISYYENIPNLLARQEG